MRRLFTLQWTSWRKLERPWIQLCWHAAIWWHNGERSWQCHWKDSVSTRTISSSKNKLIRKTSRLPKRPFRKPKQISIWRKRRPRSSPTRTQSPRMCPPKNLPTRFSKGFVTWRTASRSYPSGQKRSTLQKKNARPNGHVRKTQMWWTQLCRPEGCHPCSLLVRPVIDDSWVLWSMGTLAIFAHSCWRCRNAMVALHLARPELQISVECKWRGDATCLRFAPCQLPYAMWMSRLGILFITPTQQEKPSCLFWPCCASPFWIGI